MELLKKNIETKKEKRKKSKLIDISIIVDTREQTPWKFDNKLPSKLSINTIYIDTLEAGDYTIVGYDLPADDFSIIVERKNSLIEFIGNVGNKKGWTRFQKELEKLSLYKNAFVVIEDDLNNAYSRYKCRRGRDKYFNVPPEFLLKKFAEIKIKFGVDVCLMSNPSISEKFVLNLFKNTLLADFALDD